MCRRPGHCTRRAYCRGTCQAAYVCLRDTRIRREQPLAGRAGRQWASRLLGGRTRRVATPGHDALMACVHAAVSMQEVMMATLAEAARPSRFLAGAMSTQGNFTGCQDALVMQALYKSKQRASAEGMQGRPCCRAWRAVQKQAQHTSQPGRPSIYFQQSCNCHCCENPQTPPMQIIWQLPQRPSLI